MENTMEKVVENTVEKVTEVNENTVEKVGNIMEKTVTSKNGKYVAIGAGATAVVGGCIYAAYKFITKKFKNDDETVKNGFIKLKKKTDDIVEDEETTIEDVEIEKKETSKSTKKSSK